MNAFTELRLKIDERYVVSYILSYLLMNCDKYILNIVFDFFLKPSFPALGPNQGQFKYLTLMITLLSFNYQMIIIK